MENSLDVYIKSFYRAPSGEFFMVFTCNHKNIYFSISGPSIENIKRLPKNSRKSDNTSLIFLDITTYERAEKFELKEWKMIDIFNNLGD